MANRTKLTPSRVKKFIEHIRETGNISAAAKLIDISRTRIYELRDEEHEDYDPEFRAAWDDALAEWLDNAEQELHRRAVQGVPEPVMYKGKQVKTVQKYSDELLKFFLTAHKPDKYLTRHQMRLADAQGGDLAEAFRAAVLDVPAEKS